MQFQSVGLEVPLEKEMATHSNIFAWSIPWTKEPGGLQSMGLQRVDEAEQEHNNNIYMFICIYIYVEYSIYIVLSI